MDIKQYQLKPGTVLDNRYVINGILGEGGFGITYDAENKNLGLRVAIKEFFCRDYMSRDVEVSNDAILFDSEMSGRFKREKGLFMKEARVLKDFADDAGVVSILDYFDENQTGYIVMEFLDGVTLKDYIKNNGTMKPGEIFRKVKPLLHTLKSVHRSGLIHRDISPDNIMLMSNGNLTLIDFGAAYSYDERTRSLVIVGKTGYTAPEQYGDDSLAGPASDIYSLTATIYYCLTGKDPESSVQRLYLQESSRRMSLGSGFSHDDNSIINTGMAVKTVDRYPDALTMYEAIDKLYPDTPPGISKKKILMGFIAAAAMIIVVASSIYWFIHRVEIKLSRIKTEVFWLTPSEGTTLEEYRESSEIVKARSEFFAGKNNFLIKTVDEAIRLEVPTELFGGGDPEEICREYLTRPMELFIIDQEMNQYLDSDDYIHIERDSILSIEECNGEIAGADRKVLELPEAGNYWYFTIKLEDDVATQINAEYNNCLNKEGEVLYCYFDLNLYETLSKVFGYYCVCTGDGNSFYLIPDQEDLFRNILYYDLENKTSPKAFGVASEWKVKWEDPENTWLAGLHQENISNIEDGIQLLYSMSSYKDATLISWYHDVLVFKTRLDALQIPYAIGTLPYKEYSIVVCLREEDLNGFVASTLGRSLTLSIAALVGQENSFPIEASDYSINEEGVLFNTNSYYQENIDKAVDFWKDNNIEYVYLRAGIYDYLAKVKVADLEKYVKDGFILMTDMCTWSIGEKINKLPEFLKYIAASEQEDLILGYHLEYGKRKTNEETEIITIASPDTEMRATWREVRKSIEKDAEKLGKEVTDAIGYDSIVLGFDTDFGFPWIRIDMTDSNNYVEDALSLLQDIYEEYIPIEKFHRVMFFFDMRDKNNNIISTIEANLIADHNQAKYEISSYSVIEGENAETANELIKEANEYVNNSEFYQALLPDDWNGFLSLYKKA